jgi:hypothetical protein
VPCSTVDRFTRQPQPVVLSVAAALFIVWLVTALATSVADARPSAPKPPTTISAERAALIPALREPASASVPHLASVIADYPEIRARYALNPALTRSLPVPGSISSSRWYVVPGRGALCLLHGAFTCQSDAGVRAGRLWLEAVKPVGLAPVPPPGSPVPSTIVGVAPEGIVGVSAVTLSGDTPSGSVAHGLFAIRGTDITGLQLLRGPALSVVIPAVPGH